MNDAPPRSPTDQLREFLRAELPEFDPTGTAAQWERIGATCRERARAAIFLKGFDESVLDGPANVVWGDTLRPHPSYRVRKLRFEAFPGYWVPALMYEPADTDSQPRAAVLNADGHHDAGLSAAYKQARCINLARRGLVALNFEFIGMGELSADADFIPGQGASLHSNLAMLEIVGIGAAAPMFLAMSRALDVLIDHPCVDEHRVAMTGLSGGGWQTIVLSALDRRIALSVPVAGYTSIARRVESACDIGDLEQVPADLTTVVDYQMLTAMLAPRPALLILNEHDDCCFRTDRTKPVIFDAVRPVYETFGATGAFQFHNNTDPGNHNYGADNRRQLYAFVAEQFGLATQDGDLHEPEEILSESHVRVGLPDDQLTLQDVARRTARQLRGRRRGRPRGEVLDALRSALRLPQHLTTPAIDPSWWATATAPIEVGPWSLPSYRWARSLEPAMVVLEISDMGATQPRSCAGWVDARVGIDPIGIASMIVPHAIGLLVGTTGHRQLGLQVAQTLAVAKALAESGHKVWLVGSGVTCGIVGMCTAALGSDYLTGLTTQDQPLGSFEDLIDRGVRPHEAPSLFCADLLAAADLDDIARLLDGIEWHRGDRGGQRHGVVGPLDDV